MRALRVLLARIRGSLAGPRRDAELNDEIRLHLDLLAAEYVRRGMSPAEAAAAARREFGRVESMKESYRDQRGHPLIDQLLQDVRYALRQLRRNRGFAAAAIIILALGIGASTAIFSVIDTVLLRPLPYPDPDRLVVIHESVPTFPAMPVNAMHFRWWRDEAGSFDQMALIGEMTVSVGGSPEPELVTATRVSPSLFAMLGVRMQLGRTFRADEDQVGHDRVVVLDDNLWRRRFGGDPGAIGRTIEVDGEQYELVGVLPRDFRFPMLRHLIPLPTTAGRPQIWKPFGLREAERNPLGAFNNICLARLKPGVSLQEATRELERLQQLVAARLPQRIDLHASIVPLQAQLVSRSRVGLELLFAAVGIVLLIACINVANLLLVKTVGRGRELAMRHALGAGRGRLARQLLVESLTLCALGGIAAVAVAHAATRAVLGLTPADLPRLDEVALDARALAFAFGLTALVGVAIGLLPAWRLRDIQLVDAMKQRAGTIGGWRARRVRFLLVTAQMGLSAVCLIAGGLLLRSLASLSSVEKGFDVRHILTATVNLPPAKYPTAEHRAAFQRALVERVQAIPGVSSVSVQNQLPLRGIGATSTLTVEGTTLPLLERPAADVRSVNRDYFRTWSIPLRAGRLFELADGDRLVALVSEFTARHVWPGEDAIGKRIRFGGNPEAPFYEVVGVVGDVRGISLDREPAFAVYVPYWQRDSRFVSLAVRTMPDPAAMSSALRAAVRDVDPDRPVAALQTMEQVVSGSIAERRFQTGLVLLFAAAATLLACLGIYGVLSYAVAQRTNEIGIRLALGANSGDVRRTVVKEAMRLAAGGLLVGVPTALLVATSMRSLLFGVAPQDPPTLTGISIILLGAAALAAYVPARRASRVDPVVALRSDA